MGFLKLILNTTVKMANVAVTNQRMAIELNQRGIDLANANRYDEALNCFLQADQIMPNNPTILHNINQCRINSVPYEPSIYYDDSFSSDYEDEYGEFICDLDDMRDRVDGRDFPDDHPIYLLDIDGIDWEIGFEELIEGDMDIDDAVTRHTAFGFDENQFLIVVNAYTRDVGEQPWTADDIDEYLENTYGLTRNY
jgi:tetratricopeptide (TPR) repeat protein